MRKIIKVAALMALGVCSGIVSASAKDKAPDGPDLPPLHFTVKAFDDTGLPADDLAKKLKEFAREIDLQVVDKATDKSTEINVAIGFDDADDDNDGTADADDQDTDGDGAADNTEGTQIIDLDKGIPALMAKLDDANQERGLYFIITNQQKTSQARFNTKADALDENSEQQKDTIQTIVGIIVGELFDIVAPAKKGNGDA